MNVKGQKKTNECVKLDRNLIKGVTWQQGSEELVVMNERGRSTWAEQGRSEGGPPKGGWTLELTNGTSREISHCPSLN
jgi:hypothetical protein